RKKSRHVRFPSPARAQPDPAVPSFRPAPTRGRRTCTTIRGYEDGARLMPAAIGERFELGEVVAEGGQAKVYRARDRAREVDVAVKLLPLTSARELAAFDAEAATLRRLDHPGIVRYVAHGHLEGSAYLAMEWLEGE